MKRLLALLCALGRVSGVPCGDSMVLGTFYDGNDLAWKTDVASSQACAELCRAEAQCQAWSYFSPPKRCYLKTSDAGRKVKFPNTVSGPSPCSAKTAEPAKGVETEDVETAEEETAKEEATKEETAEEETKEEQTDEEETETKESAEPDACSVCQKSSTKGSDYKGQANLTKSGLSCQVWAKKSPHRHHHTNLPSNYCRNPDGVSGVWCYTTSTARRWDYCDVPKCQFRTVLDQQEEIKLAKNKLLSTIPIIGKEWRTTFDFKPTEVSGQSWVSVFQNTIPNTNTIHGDRLPAVFFLPSANKMRVGVSINGKSNHQKEFAFTGSPNSWTKINISQRFIGGRFLFRVFVGGKKVEEVENRQPKEFEDVKVYAGNPWFEAAPGLIRNITVRASC